MRIKPTTRHGKHKKIEATCTGCGCLFSRERRKLIKPSDYKCRSCLKRANYKLSFWPSKRLKEVIVNEGRTDKGTDYSNHLDDMKEVLWTREQKEMERAINECNKEEN